MLRMQPGSGRLMLMGLAMGLTPWMCSVMLQNFATSMSPHSMKTNTVLAFMSCFHFCCLVKGDGGSQLPGKRSPTAQSAAASLAIQAEGQDIIPCRKWWGDISVHAGLL